MYVGKIVTSAMLVAIPILFQPLGAQSFEVKTHTLKNGMKILVQEDHAIPNVAFYTFFKIGSRNERPGTTGISHFFEHMMFNGAKKNGPGEFDRAMESLGGHNNAYTSNNITAYQDWFPSGEVNLEKVFDLEADRIRDLSFDPEVIESERGVVANERRMSVENNNDGILREQLSATAYIAHSYMWPVIGWMSDIQSWKMEDLKRHWEMGYAPNNATVVVVGDVKASEVIRLAEKYFEPIPARDLPPPVTTVEPPQLGERRTVVRKPAQLPILFVAYHIPQADHSDYYALTLLDNILSYGNSSRLYQRLVDRDQLALGVGSDIGTDIDPGLFTFSARPRANINPADCEKAIYDELSKIAADSVTEAELTKAKNQMLADFYRSTQTINGRGNTIGEYEVFFGDYKKLFKANEEMNKVTIADIKRVAHEYFSENNRTVATLIPEETRK
ncbi:MAG: insulinase family protein [Holophagales bacterium]|jgi:zinc protease|nr:insulinase family protein [Holophagales bacterium]